MTITMLNPTALTLAEIKEFVKSPQSINFKSQSASERNEWLEKLLRQHKYFQRLKPEKTIIRQYIQTITGLSKSQLTRLIGDYKKRGELRAKQYQRHKFAKVYDLEEIALLSDVDSAHSCLSGPATKQIIKEEYEVFGKAEYEKLKNLSVSHMYRLRGTRRYREKVKVFSKTNPTKVPIGQRRKPEPNGRPGYLCVDTVHQGDKMGEKGVYHINLVDMATQYEFVGAVEAITERFIKSILEELLEKFPFVIIEFHADNGSEYINKVVAKLLNKLLIELTKSRPRHTNDNPLVETKNGAVVRKHMGYIHIPRDRADIVNQFYSDWFNDYLNYHRPCAFAEIKTDKKGKEKRTYPHDRYQTPYQRLKSIENVNKYLKPGVSFAKLDEIAYTMSHTDYAIQMNKAKQKMKRQIFKPDILPTKDN
jgi:transposase InsO family protein/transposase